MLVEIKNIQNNLGTFAIKDSATIIYENIKKIIGEK